MPRTPRRTLTIWLLALAMLPVAATLTSAQSYFPESEALRPDSIIAVTFSDLHDSSLTDYTLGTTQSEAKEIASQFQVVVRHEYLSYGGMLERRDFEEMTNTYVLTDNRAMRAAFLGLTLRELLFDSDELTFVGSSSSREEKFTLDSFQRDLRADTLYQAGLVYRLSFLAVGYAQGTERLRLRLVDPGFTTAIERFGFDYRAWLAGFIVGDERDFGLRVVWQRKDTPGAPGQVINLEKGFEEQVQAIVGLGLMQMEYTRHRFQQAYSPDSYRHTSERVFTLGFSVGENVGVGASQKEIVETQGFTLSGVLSQEKSKRLENLLRFLYRF